MLSPKFAMVVQKMLFMLMAGKATPESILEPLGLEAKFLEDKSEFQQSLALAEESFFVTGSQSISFSGVTDVFGSRKQIRALVLISDAGPEIVEKPIKEIPCSVG